MTDSRKSNPEMTFHSKPDCGIAPDCVTCDFPFCPYQGDCGQDGDEGV